MSKNIGSVHFISTQSRVLTSSIWLKFCTYSLQGQTICLIFLVFLNFDSDIFCQSSIILYLLRNSREYARTSIRAVSFIKMGSYEQVWYKFAHRRIIINTRQGRRYRLIEYGKIMGIFSKLCFNHGLHLAITDVLFKKQNLHVLKKKKKYHDCVEKSDNTSIEYIFQNMEFFEDANIVYNSE